MGASKRAQSAPFRFLLFPSVQQLLGIDSSLDRQAEITESGTIEQTSSCERPEQHVTGSDADVLFQGVFSEWAVNGSKRDYVVEVFRNGESTGLQFNGQLKGSRHTAYSKDNSFISQELEIGSADYLARQLRLPTFLFHGDVEAKKLFWTVIQLDQKVLHVLKTGDGEEPHRPHTYGQCSACQF